MDSRYEVFASNGKGVFSTVVRARDTARRDIEGRYPEVAIKLIRSNETMFKAAQTEVQVLKLLGSTDPENHKNVIRMLRHFEYRNHMCLVFEAMVSKISEISRGKTRCLSNAFISPNTASFVVMLLPFLTSSFPIRVSFLPCRR